MKIILSTVSFLFLIGASSAQSRPVKPPYTLPNSLMNLDLQIPFVGFQVLEAKAVIGSKNTGILLGIGRFTDNYNNYNSAKIGYQVGIVRGLYSNICLNRIALKSKGSNAKTSILRVNLGLGYTLSIGKKKRFYLNYETAYSLFKLGDFSPSRLTLTGGIGFRIGTPASTSYEGIKNVTLSAPKK